jgi:feruloyl esterase
MKMLIAIVGSVLFGGVAFAQHPSVDAAACARLAASLTLPHTTVTSARAVAAGEAVPGVPQGAGLPAFCRVAMTLTPSTDSDIRSEVWLPLSGWNGKFLHVGNGAWGGSVQYGALAAAVKRGYAAASTDTGHQGPGASFLVGHPEKMIDFGYRSVHETAVKGKATVAALYGTGPRLSYFDGCSGGGRQAFAEAQRFPEDFDGIIAGAPGYNRTVQSFQLVTIAQATHATPGSFIPASKYPVLRRAALNACDANDGAVDGLISDPIGCTFDPAVTQCTSGDGADCLTAAQVAAAKTIYAPILHPTTGDVLFPGAEPGSEMNWGGTSGSARPLGMSDDLFKSMVFDDPDWDFRTLDIAKHLDLAMTIDAGIISPTSPDIKPFIDRGGKLLMYHGWGDTNISPRSTVNYHNQLVQTLGARAVQDSVRLYMVPGMAHCGGGEGPNVFDMLTVLEQWREQGTAPAEVLASRVEGGTVVRTRPLCPHPQVPKYTGSGSIDRAENFVCQ